MFIHQTNGLTDSCCYRVPNPNDGLWIEVLDSDPRCVICLPKNITPAPTIEELEAKINRLLAAAKTANGPLQAALDAQLDVINVAQP